MIVKRLVKTILFKIKKSFSFILFSIADSWPEVFDDHNARKHWKWNPKVDLDGLVQRMFAYLERQ
jgi:nucleoside-diphosphate-sugar epimerase